MSESYSQWRLSPWWLRLFGKYVRSRYASPMIGGGWDGLEFSDKPKARQPRVAPKSKP